VDHSGCSNDAIRLSNPHAINDLSSELRHDVKELVHDQHVGTVCRRQEPNRGADASVTRLLAGGIPSHTWIASSARASSA